MKIVYQGAEAETSAATVAGFLAERGVEASRALVEYRGEVHAAGAGLDALMLEEGAELNVFALVAGG